MFERGILAHSTEALYQPVIRVPLLIFEPGREQGLDIHVPTSAVDVLPTLAQVTGHALPDWTEGQVLPPYASDAPDPQRSVYVIRAAKNPPFAPIERASVSLIKGRYKLLYFYGYPQLRVPELVRLFDIEKDPEEMKNLARTHKDIAAEMLQELKRRIQERDQPYLSGAG
jgi:choline-sulfatase